MLQQTQVKTVIPYFKSFVHKVPNFKVLSKSNEKEILKLWEGLGYYSRAKNLHKTSKILVKKYKSKITDTFPVLNYTELHSYYDNEAERDIRKQHVLDYIQLVLNK